MKSGYEGFSNSYKSGLAVAFLYKAIVNALTQRAPKRVPANVASSGEITWGRWPVSDGKQVFAAAGIWLYGFSVDSDGLTQQITRLLEDAPAAVYPTDPGIGAYVLFRSHTSSPVLRHIDLTRPWPEPSDESLQQIIPGVESSLGLTLNDWGEPQPLQQF